MDNSEDPVLDKRTLEAIGVLLPIRLASVAFQPGRHPLGRAGEGMRFLRSRPYDPTSDNPRDIDKFSPINEYWINEWEFEAQAAVALYCDVAESMNFPPIAAIRNSAVLQFTYSLWRASDRVRTSFFALGLLEEFAKPNLRSQLGSLATAFAGSPTGPRMPILDVLANLGVGHVGQARPLSLIISDFQGFPDPDASESVRTLHEASRNMRGDFVPVIVSFELEREQRGLASLRDPDDGKTRTALLTPSRIDRINAAERERTDKLHVLFRRIGVDCLTLRSEHDVFPALVKLATLRRRRRL